MQIYKKYAGKIAISVAVLLTVFVSGVAVSKNLKLHSAALVVAQAPNSANYEDQSIQAVRAVKPAVVDIVGSGDLAKGNTSVVDGTGFIIDPSGLIVSNGHVVSDTNSKYSVVFADGTQYEAKVLGLDKYDDVALLKIEASGLPSVKLGDSDKLETGQTVFTIGNSLGKYQNTVTKGVVSGLGRAVTVTELGASQPRLQNLIQTDAAINPGNSGGPLINLNGEVVGMNTLIDTGGSSLGFSIPINSVKNIIEQLQKFGKASKPYFGVSFVTVDKVVQYLKGLKVSEGAYVDSVATGGPAGRAGIKQGDVITQINHEKLTSVNELDVAVGRYQAGTQVLVTFLRNGQEEETPVILGQFGQ